MRLMLQFYQVVIASRWTDLAIVVALWGLVILWW